MKLITAADIKLRKRERYARKGDNGKILVIAGSIDYIGAAYLAGMAAFRSGADLVVVAAPEKVAWALNCLSPDIITRKFKGDFFTSESAAKIAEMSKSSDVAAIGNGIGRTPETRKFARTVCTMIKGFKVIDADAIRAVRLQQLGNAILTPHMGEYEALMRNSDCSGKLEDVQNIIGNNVILAKGYPYGKRRVNAIIAKEKIAYVPLGNPGMTVGGTGDVLAGLVAGLLAQEKDLFKAAAAAVYANGKAADQLLKKYGYGFTASDLVEKLPAVLKQLVGNRLNRLGTA